MAHDPKTALTNTSEAELSALLEQSDLIADTDDMHDDMYDWESVAYGQPKNALPGLPANTALSFFQADIFTKEIVIAIAERPGTNEPYVAWAGSPEHAAKAFLPAA